MIEKMKVWHSKSYRLISLLILFIFISKLHASDDDKYTISKCSRLHIGVMNSFYQYNGKEYSPGFIIDHNYCVKPKEHFGYGLGTGLIIYKQQTFLPIYFDFIACHKSNVYGNLQAGYGFGWESNNNYYPEYSLKGGVYAGINMGWRFKISNEFNSCISIGYVHQFGYLSSETLEDKNLHFNSLVITLGIMLESK